MKKLFFVCFIFFSIQCFGEELNMNINLEKAMNYCFTELIPKYYNGQKDFDKERKILYTKFLVGLQGDTIFHEIQGTQDLIFNFYYLINHDKQICQCIKISSLMKNSNLYEYWILNISDRGIPYNYSYFYITKSESNFSKREIIDVSKKYNESYKFENGIDLSFPINNLITLYQVEPWLHMDSFKGTKYANMIVSWKKTIPYLRKMTVFEFLFYKFKKKANR